MFSKGLGPLFPSNIAIAQLTITGKHYKRERVAEDPFQHRTDNLEHAPEEEE